MYAGDLVVIAETEADLIKRLNEWKDNVENRGLRVNMNKTKVMISGERQKPIQKAARWLYGVRGRSVGSNSIQCRPTSCQKWVHKKCNGIKGSMYKVMKSFIWLLKSCNQEAPMCTPCNTCFLEPTRVQNPNDIWISLAIFAHLTAESWYTL